MTTYAKVVRRDVPEAQVTWLARALVPWAGDV